MLIQFETANFRSIGTRQRLSMSAGRFRSERLGVVLNTRSRLAPNLLRVGAILGANGSGKSTLIKALDFLQRFVARSAQATQIKDPIRVTPFLLDEALSSKASEFGIVFLVDDTEYHYELSVTSKSVTFESLVESVGGRPLREVFSRELDESGEFRWSLGGLTELEAELWKKSTRSNASFLATAVQLNSSRLRPPFEWLTETLRVQTTGDEFSGKHTAHLIKDHVEDGCRREILNLLREADLGIRNVMVEEEEFDEAALPEDMPDEVRNKITETLKGEKFYDTRFEHRSRQGRKVLFDYDEESDGTRRLFEMAGPWISSLRHDLVLVVDELETSLHPFILRMLIAMFQSPSKTDSLAQLLFTTHSDSLLDAGLLDRDQFWFIEKRLGQTKIIPLIEYKPRKGEAIRDNYLRGRYGGVPVIASVDR